MSMDKSAARQAHPGSQPDRPIFWEPTLVFLRYAIAFLAAGSAAVLIAVFVFLPDQTLRPLGSAAVLLVALLAWYLLRRGRIEATVHVLALGFSLVLIAVAYFTGGVGSMAMIMFPQVILLLGWTMGTRAAAAMAFTAVLATLVFVLAQAQGWLPPAPYTPAALRWFVQSTVFAFSVVAIVYFVRSYRNRIDEVKQLDRDLNRAQAVAHVGSWVYDIASDDMRLSAETCRIFGLPEGVTGTHDSYLARVHPADRARVAAAWQAALKAQGRFEDEHRIMVREEVRWVRQNAELEFGEDGTPLRSVGTTQEITLRKQAEEALATSEIRFRTVLQNAPNVAVQGYKMDGTTQYWNLASEQLYGYSAQEAIGKSLVDLIIPTDMRDSVKSAIAQMAATGQPIPASELSLMRKDGSRVPVYSSHALVQTPGRDPELFCIDIDLSERKRAEAALRESEERFRVLFESAPDAMFLADPASGIILDANKAASRLLGREREEILAMHQRDLHPPQAAHYTQQTFVRHVKESQSLGFTHPIENAALRADGSTVPVEVLAQAIRIGDRTLIMGIFRDITERKQASEALRNSEERFRRLAENAPDLVYRYELAPRRGFSYVSPAATTITGFTPEEHYADPDLGWKLVLPDDRHLLESLSSDSASAGKPIELRWVRKDGTIIWTELRNLPILDDAGELIALEGMARDVTERKRNESEYRTIIQASIDGFWITDYSGRILDVNDAICRMLGYARGELIGMSIRDIDADESPTDVAARTRETIQAGSARFQTRHRRKDGTNRDVEVSVLHVTMLGERLFAFVRDITERKRTDAERARIEAQLRESQKMEALGTLAGGVAHDFNNIVAAIIGNVELARQDVGPAHPALESLDEISKASRRAKDLVQQILAFGRRQVLQRKVASLAPVIEESARLLRSTLPAGIHMRIECAPDAPAVLADATQIEQVLLNLCGNAWQAMQTQGKRGTIEIKLSSHIVTDTRYQGPERRVEGERIALRPGLYAYLTVRDDGPGMDAATRSHIFEPFFTTKPAGEGTGLGLTVVHGIVHDHDASIAVQSAPGEGAVFRIYFPAAQAADTSAAPAPAGADRSGGRALVLQPEGKHILYLDDDEAIVFLMTRLLQRQGYKVSGYTDPHEALAAVRARPREFDLAVTDYNMPGMSGLDVAQALREIRSDLPVALASGYITEELRAQAPAAGVRELIYKPNTADDFCASVARLVNTLAI